MGKTFRHFRRILKVQNLEIRVYDTRDKLEKLIYVDRSEVVKSTPLPEGCVFVSEKIIGEQKVLYKMSPEDFVKYAKAEPLTTLE